MDLLTIVTEYDSSLVEIRDHYNVGCNFRKLIYYNMSLITDLINAPSVIDMDTVLKFKKLIHKFRNILNTYDILDIFIVLAGGRNVCMILVTQSQARNVINILDTDFPSLLTYERSFFIEELSEHKLNLFITRKSYKDTMDVNFNNYMNDDKSFIPTGIILEYPEPVNFHIIEMKSAVGYRILCKFPANLRTRDITNHIYNVHAFTLTNKTSISTIVRYSYPIIQSFKKIGCDLDININGK